MKGIILAGGTGSRLWPMTLSVSKQLLPVYDKPMIYYPLSTLLANSIHDILVVTDSHNQKSFELLLGDGRQWGVQIQYAVQDQPRGIAEALIIGDDFIGDDGNVALILGDNIFHTADLGIWNENTIFVTKVADNSRYGVLRPSDKVVGHSWIDEKPKNAPDYPAVTGLYVYKNFAHKRAFMLKPSKRGELEITDLNNQILEHVGMRIHRLPPSSAWLDTGTVEDLHNASEYVRVLEQRQGIKIGCPEEAAFRSGHMTKRMMTEQIERLGSNNYSKYLASLL